MFHEWRVNAEQKSWSREGVWSAEAGVQLRRLAFWMRRPRISLPALGCLSRDLEEWRTRCGDVWGGGQSASGLRQELALVLRGQRAGWCGQRGGSERGGVSRCGPRARGACHREP